MKTGSPFILLAILLSLVSHSSAQSTISPTDKYAYAANAGWIDFRSSAANGVRVMETCLSGKAYAANIGWIDLGDGSPDNGFSYINLTSNDYGVNLDTFGNLSGHAYSANVGWIKFDPTNGQPKLDFTTGKITGFAYGANIGWIALDSPDTQLATNTIACPDTDGDGIGDAFEMLHFQNLTRATITSDSDHDSISDLAESIANTDPLDPTRRLNIISQTYGLLNAVGTKSVTLQFTSSSNRLYTIEHSTDLTHWTDSGLGLLAGNMSGINNNGFSFTDGPRHFFRVAAHKPLP